MTDRDRTDERRALDDFANTDAQPNQPLQPQQRPPHGQSLVRPTSGLAERVIGAQQVAVYRDDARVMQKLTQLAAAAGDDWFYRFPVKKKDGGVSTSKARRSSWRTPSCAWSAMSSSNP